MLINNTGGLGMSDALYASERHNARSARNTIQGSAAVWCVCPWREICLSEGGDMVGVHNGMVAVVACLRQAVDSTLMAPHFVWC